MFPFIFHGLMDGKRKRSASSSNYNGARVVTKYRKIGSGLDKKPSAGKKARFSDRSDVRAHLSAGAGPGPSTSKRKRGDDDEGGGSRGSTSKSARTVDEFDTYLDQFDHREDGVDYDLPESEMIAMTMCHPCYTRFHLWCNNRAIDLASTQALTTVKTFKKNCKPV